MNLQNPAARDLPPAADRVAARTSIMLCTGRLIDLLAPDPAVITIEVIARGLARQPRFAGQTTGFLSVAEHSLNVAALVRPGLVRAAMLHDAPEAILGDVPTPLKRLLPEYEVIENRMANAVALAFGFPSADVFHHPDIKAADAAMAWAEARWTMPHHAEQMPGPPDDPDMRRHAIVARIACDEPARAERLFLREWNRHHWAMAERQAAA